MFDASGPVLGIDPGLTRCGYGAVSRRGATAEAVAYGVLCTDVDAPIAQRLATLQVDVVDLIAEVAPCALAVERLLFQHNVRTAVAVGQASGIVLAAAARAGIPVTSYSPNEVKLAVTGSGTAGKPQMQAMVRRLLALDAPPAPFDAADALALALCHAWGAPLRAATAVTAGDDSGVSVSSGVAVSSLGGSTRLAAAVERALAREEAS